MAAAPQQLRGAAMPQQQQRVAAMPQQQQLQQQQVIFVYSCHICIFM